METTIVVQTLSLRLTALGLALNPMGISRLVAFCKTFGFKPRQEKPEL